MDDWLVSMSGSHLKLASINHSGLLTAPGFPIPQQGGSLSRRWGASDEDPDPILQAAPSPADVSHGRRGLVPSGLICE